MSKKAMEIPKITATQYVVLRLLAVSHLTGRELRESLSDLGQKRSKPGFYQLMSRLEDAKLVESATQTKEIEGYEIRENKYSVTQKGIHAIDETVRFYNAPEAAWNPA